MAQSIRSKVLAVQASSAYLNLDATVKKAVKLIKEATFNGAKLIGFPEGFIPQCSGST